VAGAELDLPLAATPTSRMLLWLTAGLVYLALLAFGVAAVADGQLDAFKRQPRIVTVALPPNPEPAAARAEVMEVLDLLRARPGVAYASLIDDAEIDSLVQPWLGTDATALDTTAGALGVGLPLPRLIDIAYNPGVAVDLAALDRDLAAIVPGTTIGDAGLLQRSQERMATLFRGIAGGIGLVLVLGAVGIAVWITRLDFRLHRDAVDLLRLMGAKDRYIAQQFEHHALGRSLRGGFLGFCLGLSTVTLVLYGPPLLGREPLAEPALAPVHWVLFAIVPVATALFAALGARFTAHFGLARMR
jgi:cell division transport system permease protein